jgi:uncharacterized protein YndB with AHSA1/START domain
MAAIVEELTIEAGPQRVFSALTQQDEIVQWWAYEAQVQPEVGSLGEFRFRQGAFAIQFEVAELEQDKKVRWLARQVPPQWAGTSVTWQLEPIHNGTQLLFTHDGFAQIDEQVGRTWAYFLSSLKSYLETGKGTPGNPPGFN